MEPATGPGTSEYVYSPLTSKTSIRLLKLLPGRGDVIECQILECSMDNPTSFQALSYSWGSDENSKTIVCAGKQYLRVRSNLYHALWFIRHPTISKTLWVDAICIDQGEVLERNHQVSQMTSIYTKAEKVIIWLGNENNDVAVKFIARLAMTAQNQNANHGMLIKPRIHRNEWQALRHFLNASWFRRMWVVQELVLGLQMEGPMATEILLGQHSVLWAELVRCCEWTKENYASLAKDAATALISDAIYSSIERVLHLHHMALQREQGQQIEGQWTQWLLATLPTIRDKQATDPRDKLFALYGLCTSLPQPLPDYTLTTEVVFQAYARDVIRDSWSLDILHERETRQTAIGKELPSWVPDWSTKIERTSFRMRRDLRPNIKISAAGQESFFTFIESPDSSLLPMTGLIIDEIIHTGDVITMDSISQLKQGRDSWMYKLWRSWKNGEFIVDQTNAEMAAESNLPYHAAQPSESRFTDQRSNSKGVVRGGQSIRVAGMKSAYRNEASDFSCFVRTMITNIPLAGLDALINDGDDRFWELLSNTARSMSSPAGMLKVSSRDWKLQHGRWSERFGRYRSFLRTQGVSTSSETLALLTAGLHIAPPRPVIEDSTMETYLTLLAKWGRGRRFFTTKGGYMGLGVEDTAAGDRVAVLHMNQKTSRTPFLISPETQSLVRLVGEAYIHDFKYPEADDVSWTTMNFH